MWHWDQGRLAYFQFDSIRRIASFVVSQDFKAATKDQLYAATGLHFKPASYDSWRNYSRTLKLCLLVSEVNKTAVATPTAQLLAQPGKVTCDEYFHFFARVFTEPSPALSDWHSKVNPRYPLLFALKYILAKASIKSEPVASINEIIGAYTTSKFNGSENDEDFAKLINRTEEFETAAARIAKEPLFRQARESLQVLAQISYLYTNKKQFIASINREDARQIFRDLCPILGPRENESNREIERLAHLFVDGYSDIPLEYPKTIIADVIESGFVEGSKVKRTHLTIERNSGLRREFFRLTPTSVCDVCLLDTAITYPWTDHIIDLHHLLPLSSGTRMETKGTTFADLVPVCPTCHRAIHRFYDNWLRTRKRKDFADRIEAKATYDQMKAEFPGVQYV